MKMNSEIRLAVRTTLMRACSKVSPASLPLSTLMDAVSNAGFPEVDATDVSQQLAYLVDKKWLKKVTNKFSPGQARWKIRAKGQSELEKQGLV